MNLYDIYNFNDMVSVLKIDKTLLNKVIKKYNIKSNSKFLPSTSIAKIKISKLILKKTESVTYNDFNQVKSILEQLYYDEKMSGSDINNLFQLGITNFTSYLSKMFNITLRSVTNSVKNYYKNLGTYDNKTQKELYYMQCEFKFSGKIYSKLPGFELVKQ